MAILLTQPALLLIDSGHFQYNSVMLGSCSVGSLDGEFRLITLLRQH